MVRLVQYPSTAPTRKEKHTTATTQTKLQENKSVHGTMTPEAVAADDDAVTSRHLTEKESPAVTGDLAKMSLVDEDRENRESAGLSDSNLDKLAEDDKKDDTSVTEKKEDEVSGCLESSSKDINNAEPQSAAPGTKDQCNGSTSNYRMQSWKTWPS